MDDLETRATPSLLDRLTDREPDARQEPPLTRSQSLRALRVSLSRDLSTLLNTKRRDEEVPEQFSEANQSLLTFGLPDFTALSLKSPTDQNKLRRAIETAIRRFEPRLEKVSVTLEPRAELDPVLRFHVDALLRVEPAPEPISFDTVLQADTGHFLVQGGDR